MNEDVFTRGNKIRFTYRGVVIEGTVQITASDGLYVGVDAPYVYFSRSQISDVTVLERPEPADNYPVGTALRWNRQAGWKYPVSTFEAAIKQDDGNWHYANTGGTISWLTLLRQRPLTVLVPTEAI